jgi:general L-amino acid transport system substrate-binding protein
MLFALLAFPSCVILTACPAHADALDDIRHRGHLLCDVNIDTDDYSGFDSHGDVSDFEGAYCRAIAAAILGDPAAATIRAKDDEITGLREVRDGRADLMIGATPDPALGLAMHLQFASPILIDGLGFLVDPKLGVHDIASMKNDRICFVGYTPEATIAQDLLDELGIKFAPFPFSEVGEMEGALATNHCNLSTADVTKLANQRLSLPGLATFTILPQTIATDPLSPALRDNDARLMAIVQAVDGGLLQAETHGVTRANAARLAQTSTDPIIRRLVGADGWIGPTLTLDKNWLLRAVVAVGNHAEIFQRTVGSGSKLRLPVGANTPVSAGGALWVLPVAPGR